MKKLWFTLLLVVSIALLLTGCGTNPENEIKTGKNQAAQEEFIFHGYGANPAVPDFLTEEQQNIYKMAISLYDVARSPDVLDMERFFPLKNGQEFIAPNEGIWVPDYTADDGSMYAKSIGRYRKWADFEKLVMAVFTTEGFNQLNKYKTFIEKDGNLYFIGATGMPRQGYLSGIDIFNLISSNEKEIRFTVTGYFGESVDNHDGEITTNEIILIKTENGWRFSQFSVVWG